MIDCIEKKMAQVTSRVSKLHEANVYNLFKEYSFKKSSWAVTGGKKYINFSSNDYLGLRDCEVLKTSAHEALDLYGLESLNKSKPEIEKIIYEIEYKLVDLFHKESAVFMNSGYACNLLIINSFRKNDSIIFCDHYSHASILDAIRLSNIRKIIYNHNDILHLARALRKNSSVAKKIIITDSVFSMAGDVCNLSEIVKLAGEYHASIMLDEAHALGVFGGNGRGLSEHMGLEKNITFYMASFSKALACFGGFVVGAKEDIEPIKITLNQYEDFFALPLILAITVSRSLDLFRNSKDRRTRLWDNVNYFKMCLRNLGYEPNNLSPIFPFIVGDDIKTCEIAQKIERYGIMVSPVLYPAVPKNTGRLRINITASHTKSDIDYLLNVLKDTYFSEYL